ncbi:MULTISPECIES: YncE family protein [unclassified Micromonospora]|uniref:YncE family protein n=1 Tax=unclassified Micromonospora TaxID=2617518 RepID=UPI002FF1ED12
MRWAYCIDLPHPFGEAAAIGHAMTISPDGGRLFVADVTSGTIAEIDTEELSVRRTDTQPRGVGTAHAAADSDRLFIGAGTLVRTMDLTGPGRAADWWVGEPVCGLVLSRDGRRLYVGQNDGVSWHDPCTGTALGRVTVPRFAGVRGLAGPA